MISHTKNLFDFTRLMAAIMVIIGHSGFVLGLNANEYFGLLFGVKAIHSSAVCIFFAISGYLITKSFIKNPSTYVYFKNRVLRIIPGLCLFCLVSFVVIGVTFSYTDYKSYVINNYNYLFNVFLFPDNYKMDGVFETNSDANYINRSLWTLKYEFLMYLIILLFGVLGLLKEKIIYLFMSLLFVLFWLSQFINQSYQLPLNIELVLLIKFSFVFFCGSAFFFLETYFKEKNSVVFAAVLLLYFLMRFLMPASENRFLLLDVLFPILTLCFCKLNIPFINNSSKFGDFSYGIYLWGYPVQQSLEYVYKDSFITHDIYLFSFVSIIVSLLFAIISWYLIESPFLKLKQT